MIDNYSPRDAFERPFSNAIFAYEFKRLTWSPELEDIRRADWTFTWKLFIFQVAALGILVFLRPFYVYFDGVLDAVVVFFVLLGPIFSTVIVDLSIVGGTTFFWHSRVQMHVLDVLRLAMPTDADLLTTLRAVAELIVWRRMRWEMAARSFDAFLGIGAAIIFGVIIVSLARVGNLVLFILIPIWVARLFLLFIREPLWRMRALVALSIAVAIYIHDGNGAILIASAVALGLKVLQVMLVVVLFAVTVGIYSTRFNPDSNYAPILIWLAASSLFTTRLVRLAYGSLHTLCTWLTLRALRA